MAIFDEKDRMAADLAEHIKNFMEFYPNLELYDEIHVEVGYPGPSDDIQLTLIVTPDLKWSWREMI